MTLRYGIIGCGMMGQEHIRNILLLPDAAIHAIVEPDTHMQLSIKTLLPTVEFESTINSLLKRKDLDALLIASPNFMHAEQLLEIFQKSDLPILVEKPLVTRTEDIEKIKQAAAAHPAPVWVAMEYRYMPPVAALLTEIKKQTHGHTKQFSIREHRFPFLEKVNDWNRFNENTGGTLVEKCCHFFDLMRLQANSEAVRVFASGGQDVNHIEERYDGKQPDILDNAFVIVDFANGQRALLELSMFAEGSEYQEELCVVGEKAKIEAKVPGPGRFWNTNLGPAPLPKLIVSPRNPTGPIETPIPVDPNLLAAGDHNGSTYYQHLGFYNAITEGADVEVTVEDGLKAVVLGLAAQESIKTGQAMRISNNGLQFS
ncbi:Gfo/Idh/MocA family oxidoreductase [Reinekea marina]|uniref:Gfo/Idh/MocA family protein n=1 Tax=Reinekea marina TaxID=1310421 RepID=A0ABV7WSW4_9GAMM|nr:Gfo/Idh/MocA family oxidoreductase [Reinekea marina]MDN3647609.1 Gfo/Idh/MocA family oxidoreductase [Reinekea marina]